MGAISEKHQRIINSAAKEFEQYQQLPFGVYVVDWGSTFLLYNEKAQSLFNLPDKPTYKDQKINFYQKNGERAKFLEQLKEKKDWISNKTFTFQRNGDLIYVRYACKAIFENGDSLGILSIVEEISEIERHHPLYQVLKVGVFRYQEDIGLVEANQLFYEMLNNNSDEGTRLEEFSCFLENLTEKEGIFLEQFSPNAGGKEYEVRATFWVDSKTHKKGIIGTISDVTIINKEKKKVAEFRHDAGKTLHTYSSTLINTKNTIEGVLSSYKGVIDSQFDTNKPKEYIEALIQKVNQLKDLTKTFEEQLLDNIGPEHPLYKKVHGYNYLFNNHFNKFIGEVSKIALIRDLSLEYYSQGNQYADQLLRDPWRKIKAVLNNILEFANTELLSNSLDNIIEIDDMLRSFRENLTKEHKNQESYNRKDLLSIINSSIKHVAEYSARRKIKITKQYNNLQQVLIDCEEKDLMRAIINIIHNAIKYSWTTKDFGRSTVKLSVSTVLDQATITIENRGVKIKEEEIDLIFEMGFRGEYSGDQNRLGTGIGLYDSKQVFEDHGGSITIHSKEGEIYEFSKIDRQKPYYTTVIITLPIIKSIEWDFSKYYQL